MQGRGKVLSLITEYKKRWQCYVPQKFYKEYINQYVKHIKHRLLLFLDNSSGDVAMTDVNITLTLKKVSPEMRLRKSSIPLDNKEGKWSASGPRGRGWSEKEDSGNESGQFSIRFILSSASSILPHYHLFSSAYKLIQVLTGCGDTCLQNLVPMRLKQEECTSESCTVHQVNLCYTVTSHLKYTVYTGLSNLDLH